MATAAMPRMERIHAALDIGSSKVTAMIAGETETGVLVVLGSGQHASEGIKRGYVVDLDRAEAAIRSAVERAERLAGLAVREVWVCSAGGGLASARAPVEIEIGGGRIEQDDLDELFACGEDVIQPNGRSVLHALPADYVLDGRGGVRKPIGLHAERLGVRIHVVMGDGAPLRNLDHAVRAAHLGVRGIVASPIAAAQACLRDEEREIGVGLVEFGGAVTTVTIFRDGVMEEMATLPIGAGDITDAIAGAFGIRRSQAERLKCVYGSAVSSRADHRTMVPVNGPGEMPGEVPVARNADDQNRIAKAEINAVIGQFLERWTGDLTRALRDAGAAGKTGLPLVLTGGGAELAGIADYVQSAIDRPVRIGRPGGMEGLPEANAAPRFTALVGLLRHAAAPPPDIRTMQRTGGGTRNAMEGSMLRRMWHSLRENF